MQRGIKVKKRIAMLFILSTFLLTGFSAQAATCDAIQVTASSLNVRTGPSASNTKVGSIQTGEQYVKVGESGNWAQIWFDEQSRWVSAAAYTEAVSVDCGKVTAGTLNVRSGAGSGYAVVGTMPYDSEWVTLENSGSWKKVFYKSEQRWVYGVYLDTTEQPLPISVTGFSINNGDISTESQFVTTTQTINESLATEYQLSENSGFSDAIWTAYVSNSSFTLSSGDATKTLYYRVKNADGRVSDTVSDTIDLITPMTSDRMIDPTVFFNEFRNQFGSLNQSQVDGINFLLINMVEDTEAAFTELPVYNRQMAYLWATTKHEVANTFLPITEFSNTHCVNYDGGCLYKGRGYVQLTHRYNYASMSPIVGVDLVEEPTLALVPDIAYTVMSYGSFNGVFTGRALGQYINTDLTDYYNARRVINGTDKASLIRGYAEKFQIVMDLATE